MNVTIHDNESQSRYEMFLDGELAGFEVYHLKGQAISLIHTEVVEHFAGQGLARPLVVHALDDARARGLAVLPLCPYVAHYISTHAEDYLDLVPEARRSEFGL